MAATSPLTAHAEFAAAFNAGDLDALCDMYEADAIFVPANGATPIKGIDGIRAALNGFLVMKPKMEIETIYASENGDLALLRSRWKLKAIDTEGNLIEQHASSVEVLRRQPDGTWRQIIDQPYGAD